MFPFEASIHQEEVPVNNSILCKRFTLSSSGMKSIDLTTWLVSTYSTQQQRPATTYSNRGSFILQVGGYFDVQNTKFEFKIFLQYLQPKNCINIFIATQRNMLDVLHILVGGFFAPRISDPHTPPAICSFSFYLEISVWCQKEESLLSNLLLYIHYRETAHSFSELTFEFGFSWRCLEIMMILTAILVVGLDTLVTLDDSVGFEMRNDIKKAGGCSSVWSPCLYRLH